MLSEFWKHRSFSVIHVTARWPWFRLLPVLYCFANFLHSLQSVDGHVVKWASNQYPYSILACVHTVAIAAMLIFTDITSGFSALLMARRIIKFTQKRRKKGPIQIMQFILLYHSFTATMQQALQFTTRVGKNKLDS